MRITKQRLEEIIKEELAALTEDDKVSKKIAHLMDKEGKPHKQAVAMALNMVKEEEDKEDDTDEDEVSDEDALVLKGPKVDPLGDSLAARRLRAIARRKAGDK